MSHLRNLARQYWFDLLVALLAIAAMVEVALGRGHRGAPHTTLWFCLPAIAILGLLIFARRWFPFAGPALYWVLGAGIMFVDPLLIPYAAALVPVGLADAFLLGNLRDVRKAGAGLAVYTPQSPSFRQKYAARNQELALQFDHFEMDDISEILPGLTEPQQRVLDVAIRYWRVMDPAEPRDIKLVERPDWRLCLAECVAEGCEIVFA